ncbi:hypothetical protein L2744_00820 [Shewanella profunda]|uniref:hypothetical protein n=1 Tax=Shewanella profunda TaxID=254793 RepID=UPI00200E5276|nr:hypothetical protein [Shewanella profunda]MCL1088176.1 hypothetical protein [Shewanella profunda]
MNRISQNIQSYLLDFGLSNVSGSPYDNAYDVFKKNKNEINLVVMGTNGNMTDYKKTNKEWVSERSRNSDYCHLSKGNWGKSPLREELLKLPSVLNDYYGDETFDKSRMILTNGLLLASEGVSDIPNRFKQLKEKNTDFSRIGDIVKSSMDFFHNCTLSLSSPSVIFAYGNADSGHSAWKYLTQYYKVKSDIISIPKGNTGHYKFCSITIGDRKVHVIGSPHPSYGYNHLESDLISKGLSKIA